MKYRAAAAAVALLIASCDCGGSTLTILRGRLEVSPREIDFGTVAVGETARRTIAASNSGGAPIESIELRVAAPFSLSEPPESIDAGESISILVAFRASDEGTWSDALAIESDSGSASIDLSAEALGPDIGEPIDTPDDPNIDAPDVVPEEAGRFLYFWQVASPMQSDIVRIPLQGGSSAAPFFGQSTGAQRCPGCHQVSPDGRYVAIVELDVLLRPTAFILEVESKARTELPPELASASSFSWRPNETDRFAAGVAGDILLGSLSRGYLGPLVSTPDEDAMPSWGSNGEIAFVRGTFTRLFEGVAFEGPTDLMIISEDGGTAIALPGASANGVANYYPTFSPDGAWIAFTQSASPTTYAALDAQVRLVDRSGAARDLAAINDGATSFPTWSVDGSYLSVSSNRGGGAGGWDIYLAPIDRDTGDVAGPITNLTEANTAAFEHGVQWSP